MKRFYKDVSVAESEGGFEVRLDGRPLRTPAGAALRLPNRALAEAIAGEWAGQVEVVRPQTMPFMQLAATAIDRVGPRRADVIGELLNYASTDLVCYRAESPGELATLQAERWQPALDWACLRFDSPLLVTQGVMPIAQPAAALNALAAAVAAYDDLRLAGLHGATVACGSLVLGLAVAEGRLGADEAAAASQLDELYQAELWGEVEEAAERRQMLRAEVAAVAAFLAMLRT